LRQNLYTCCRCGQEQRTSIEHDDAPIGWATLAFQRDTVDTDETPSMITRQYLTTHACTGCCAEVLAFLEKSTRPDVDRAFDDGGEA
jgi:hypothetical protein